jgi:HEAT repeat protein
LRLLRDDNARIREGAIRALAQSDDPALVSALSQLIKTESNARVVEDTLRVLWHIPKRASNAIPVLIALLCQTSEEMDGRFALTVDCLASIGSPAIPYLERVFSTSSNPPRYRRASLRCLLQFGRQADGIRPAIYKAFQNDPDEDVRLCSGVLLEDLPAAKDMEGALRAVASQDPSVFVKIQACRLLYQLTPNDKLIELTLTKFLTGPFPDEVRQASCYAAGKVGRNAKWAVRALMGLLADPDPEIRVVSANALGHIGRSADAALPALRKLQMDPSWEVSHAADLAISRIIKSD